MLEIIHSDQLTREERQRISNRYDGYDDYAEFWIGFVDYQSGRPNPYGNNCAAGQAWDRGAEAAMNVVMARYRARERCEGCAN